MIIGKSRIPYFIIKSTSTIGVDIHIYAFKIENNSSSLELARNYLSYLSHPTLTIFRVLVNCKIYVTLKYAL